MLFILQIAIVLIAAKVAGQISVRLGQPSVLGKIIAGIIIGPAILGWVSGSEIITIFSEIGVLLLMFLAGMETDLKSLNKNMKSAVVIAVLGVITPILLGWWGGSLFGLSTEESIFLGLLLAATSVSISVQTLKEIGWLNSREGATLLGAAVLDDVIVIILIAVAMGIFVGADTNIALLLGKQVLFFVGIILAGKWFIPQFIRAISRFKITEPVVSSALIIVFASAYFADALGVSGIIGTYFAGLFIAKTEFAKEVEERVSPIAYGIFVPFFFINIGLAISFDGVGNQVGFIVVLTIIALLSKFIGCGLGARLTGFNTRSSMGIGAGMISRGEVALILATMGLESGLINGDYYTSIILVVIITTLVTPPLLKMIFGKREEEATA